MAVTPFKKLSVFAGDVGNKVHNLGSDVLKIMLTDTVPGVAAAVKTDITEIAAAHGYTAGGATIPSTAYSQTAGLGKLTGGDVTITASGGAFGPFRYAVIYNSTASGGPLIGYYDYGAEVTVDSGGATTSVKFHFDSSLGILTLN